MNAKCAGGKRKYNPCLNTDTVLWWLQPTPEMGQDLRVWDLCIDYSRFIKNKKTKKGKKWYELTPRYQRARPKYGQSALHLSSGRENKQALSGVHETLHPIGIALFGLTAWGSNPQKGLRLKHFFFTILYMVPFDFCAPNCPLAVKCLSLEHDPPAEKEKTYE